MAPAERAQPGNHQAASARRKGELGARVDRVSDLAGNL